MNNIGLRGLRASTPLGAMAAFGLLRVCEHLELPRPATLGWLQEPDWIAQLGFPEPVEAVVLVEALAEYMKVRTEAAELRWQPDIKMPSATFADFARTMRDQASQDHRETVDFLAAFGSELVLAKSKPEVKPSAFYMTAGQQKFLLMASELAKSLDPGGTPGQKHKVIRAFEEALLGPWRYQDPQHSLGWDPSTERLHALRACSPSDRKDRAVGVAAALWLAFESLPLFPVASVNRRLVTGGFDGRGNYFSWPVWETPLPLTVVRSLLVLAELTVERPLIDALQTRGIRRVYRCRRVDLGDKGYAIFRPAELVV